MKKLFIYTAVIFMSTLTSCYDWGPCIDGTGLVLEEAREVSGFVNVSNTTSFDVYVSQADTFSVRVVAQESLIPVVETYRSGSTLLIKTPDFTCVRNTSPVEIFVTMPEIEGLDLTGSGIVVCEILSGDIVELTVTGSGTMWVDSLDCEEAYLKLTSSGQIECDEILSNYTEVKVSGSGDIEFGDCVTETMSVKLTSSGKVRGGIFDVYKTDLTLTGSGRISLDGNTEELVTSHSASGRIDALELEALNVRTNSTGSGNTYVYANDFLDVTILGSGNVIYLGTPELSYHIVGSGSLRPY